MVKVGIHQPNLCPWLPFFYKMAMCDKFVILTNVQFEKGGYQNRYSLSDGRWVTRSVQHGLDSIKDKKYADLLPLLQHNMNWIWVIKETLGITTEIIFDTDYKCESATDKLIYEIRNAQGDTYVTNPEAKNKYLDENRMKECGINIEYCKVPKHLQIGIFEAFAQYGIDGTIKQLPKRKDEITNTVLQLS